MRNFKHGALILSVSLFFLFIASSLFAAEDRLVVGVKTTPPFVNSHIPLNSIVDPADDASLKPKGFVIDIVNDLLRRMDNRKKVVYRRYPNMSALIDGVSRGEVDIGAGSTTINSKRERIVDFSQPFYEADIGIMTKKDVKSGISSLNFFSFNSFLMMLLFIAYIIVVAHLFWFLERGGSVSGKYISGIGESVWWSIVTMSTVGYGDFTPRKPKSRLLGGAVIFSGIIVFSVATAAISSMMTVKQLKPAIAGPEDLSGRKVGMVEGAVTVEVTSVMGLKQKKFKTLELAIDALKKGEVEAVVHDRPALQNILKQSQLKNRSKEEKNGLTIVDKGFYTSMYGFSFPPGNNETREKFNVALLSFLEDKADLYGAFHKKWFGQ